MAWQNINSQDISTLTATAGSFSDNAGQNGVSDGYSDGDFSSGDYLSSQTNKSYTYEQNFITNSLYYNPNTTYQTWMQANGIRMSGGTAYSSAYSNANYLSGAIDLGGRTQTFYAPKDPNETSVSALSRINNYYRYRIPAGGTDVVRAEYGKVVLSTLTLAGYPVSGQSAAKNGWVRDDFTFPAGTTEFTVSTSGGTGNADLYVRKSSAPSTSSYNCRSNSASNTETCTFTNPGGSTWHIGAFAKTAFSGLTVTVTYKQSNTCDGDSAGSYGWINCTSATPTGRTVAAELSNFATWFSYHRNRIKSAKAGAADAFRPLSNKVRVGFRTIWERGTFDIPVGDGNDGRFVDNDGVNGNPTTTSRTQWYNALFDAYANNGTPLQNALNKAGQYFSKSGADGPYGPESGSDQYSCRQNFAILTTDGYWNTSVVSSGNQDGTAGSPIKGAKGATYTYSPSNPYKDSVSNTLADVAMYYWKTDLRTDISKMGTTASPNGNNVPTTDADPAFWQHMVTFSIALGLKTTKGWSSVSQATAAIAGGDTWPSPDPASCGSSCPDKATRLDDLLHAAVNGHGEFISASSPAEFTAGLTKALASIAKRTSSFSNVATNSTSLNTGAKVFSASYVSGDWTGALKAQAVSKTGVSSTISWEASIPAVGSRNIYTASGTPGQAGTAGATFPTGAQQGLMARTGGPVNYEVTALDNAAYLKGSSAKEERNGVGNLRDRPSTVLGDIVGSSPAYVKDTDTIYVGANDGMMHAFSAVDGKELFAYVPNLIDIAGLSTLSRGDYSHRFFVDGPISVTPRSLTPGKNILVGTLGRGGKGLYALDVSSPAAFGTGSFKWERKDTSGTHMGMVLGTPILANVRNGSATPAVVIGNGPNSSSDKAVLIVMNLETGAVIREIDTGAGGTGSPNGLFSPLGLYGADGKTLVYVYAGDMLGNVWKFDLRSTSPGSWTAKKIFAAKSGQAITSGLAFAVDPKTNKRWVFFGTGRFLTTTDADDKTPYAQSMYGVIDDDAGSAYTRANLTSRSITVSGDYRYFQAKSALASTSKGWYVDLPGKGERIVQDALIDGDYAVMASMIPEGDACDASGTGYINAIDAFTGTSGGKSYFDLGKDGTTDDTGAGGNPIGSVNLGVGMPTRPVLLPGIGVGSGSAGTTGEFGKTPMSWQRVSWREIRND
ncbi:MAG: pre-peptidase C-terminal domain-containing protein, partial [Rhodanobacteraceae bacterium]|nr:pre-peptidase C-terminal domain-containing protein [Rhodanobacteraceae bacterium]